MFAAYATSSGRALVDRELCLPWSWTSDRDRCRTAKIPDERGFASKGELARISSAAVLPPVCPPPGSPRMRLTGRTGAFAVCSNNSLSDTWWRCPSPSRSSPWQASGASTSSSQLIEEAPADAWQRLSCGDGAKGPRVYDWAAAKPPVNLVFDPDPPTHHRWIMARRGLSDPREIAHCLAYAPVGIELAELVRIAGSRWAIEECFRAAKNERGLDQCEVRRYIGWYRHITQAMLAHAVLASLAAQAASDAAKSAAETDQPSSRSPWQRSGGSWTLSCPAHEPTAISPTH